MDVLWSEQVCDDCDLVGSLSLVGSVDRSGPAIICPVDVILKLSQSLDDVVVTHNYGHKSHNIIQ